MSEPMKIVASTPDELLAAVPHLLGFTPHESLVVVPAQTGPPVIRVDLPRTGSDRAALWEALRGPYSQHASPGTRVAIVAVTRDLDAAEAASEDLAERLGRLGIETMVKLWSDGEHWRDFATGNSGVRTAATAEVLAARTVAGGHALPEGSRDQLAATLVGDRRPIVALIDSARQTAEANGPASERTWALGRFKEFQEDGVRLSDDDAARMLLAVESTSTRNAMLDELSQESATSHIAFWTDLTRRAPDEVRAAPAASLGLASWVHGDGARAWCALDEVPEGASYPLADAVGLALQNGLHPREWNNRTPAGPEANRTADESFVPSPRSCHRDYERPPTASSHEPPQPGR